MITSRQKGRWIFPKGVIESGADAAETAAQEAWEEGGVHGEIRLPSIGVFSYYRSQVRHQVEMFALQVISEANDWPEQSFRRRAWMSPADASRNCRRRPLRVLFDQWITRTSQGF